VALASSRISRIREIAEEKIMKKKLTKAEVELAVYYEIYNYGRENETRPS
jgi:hypothetical protein